ncbi:hypothetical protein [Salmonirosea aquatica]|uniref:Uncharacterized protein n=1 Tax=Salmonirosea aquatica TaxID=2654236 RepID=A0A7C9BGG2_9BACT|nr:hypothetical protein [Cytophagaceae bacterium SJW1-29]
MSNSRAHYLIDRLIKNSLSEDELSELLAAIGREQMTEEYSELLENYFSELLQDRKSVQN